MKYTAYLKQSFVYIFIIVVSFSCQENSSADEITALDEDMISATDLANDHLSVIDGRLDSKVSVTVFRYIDGKLHYATDTDSFTDYQEVNEETVTADVVPGEYIFWYAGRGVTNLRGIEFDAQSRNELNGDAKEAFRNRLWYVRVPNDIRELDLKYDILYRCIEYRNTTIRLDPKIKINQ